MPEFSEAELGRMQPPVVRQDADGLPRGGTFPLAHVSTYAAQLGNSARAYSQRFDDAMKYSRLDADRMRLDPIIAPCLDIRAFTTSLLTWSVVPEDESDPDQKKNCDELTRIIKRTPRFVEGLRWLLYDGIFSGRSALCARFGWGVDRRWQCTGFRPVLGDKLAFKWDGSTGLSVNLVSVHDKDKHLIDFLDLTPVYWLTPDERECMIVHRQFAEDTDYMRWQSAGSIHGVGLRQKLYWVWKLKQDIWKMGLDFLQWFARGLMVYYFDSGNDEHLKAVKYWVEHQDGNSAMLFPVLPTKAGQVPTIKSPVERFDVGTASPAFLQQLLTTYFDELEKFIILHQIGTTSAMSTGLGSGQSQAHETTFDAVVKMDALMLGESLTQDFLGPLCRANFPGMPLPRFSFNIDTPNVQQTIDTAEAIVNMGGSVSQELLEEAGGFSKPKQTDTILGGPQASQPVAVGSTPSNMPMVSGDATGQQPVN